MQPPAHGRGRCYRCHKPTVSCVCADVVAVDNQTRIHILQHKRERFHPIGTARFAQLGLTRSRVLIDAPGERDAIRQQLVGDASPVGVLYPSPHARLLSELAPAERPRTLIVLDGTWSHARTLARSHPWLEALPHYALAPANESLYRIRKEPFAEAISTIEAVVQALGHLEPELTGLDGLVRAFVRMIDKQIELGSQRTGRPRSHKPRQISRTVPAALSEKPSRVVLVFGELSAPAPGLPYELVSWCALRLADGATFQHLCRPQHSMVDLHLQHMGLSRAELEAGTDHEGLRQAWAAFARRDDVWVAWNHSTLEAGRATLGEAPSIALKAVYANLRRRGTPTGSLAQVLEREGLTALALPFSGRARTVLGMLAPAVELFQTPAGRGVAESA